MLDYISRLPAPTTEEAINMISDKLEKIALSKNIDRKTLEKIVSQEIEKYGGREKFGSYSGWTYYSFRELVQQTKTVLYTID